MQILLVDNTTCDLPVEIYSDVNMICENLVLLNSGEIFDFANPDSNCGFIEDGITFGHYSYISCQEGGVCYTGEVYAESKLKDIPSVKDSLVEGIPEYDHYYPAYQGLVGYAGNDLVFYGL